MGGAKRDFETLQQQIASASAFDDSFRRLQLRFTRARARIQVGTRGKGLRRASDDDSADRGIGGNAFDSQKHLPQHGPSKAGKLVGAFERNKKDGAAQLETDGGVHRALSLLALGHAVLNELHDVLRGGAGKKNFGDAGLLEDRDVCSGNDAADEHGDVGHPFFGEECEEARA